MGTNFYLHTTSKEIAKKYAPYDYEVTDEPYFSYEIHIAKTSMGWLPLFQGHRDGICSVYSDKDLEEQLTIQDAYSEGCRIFDEYGDEYTWGEFEERVINFNGGIKGKVKPQKIKEDKNSPWYDADMPDHIPVSHFEYGKGKYASDYFTDNNGYEFDMRD